VDQVFEGDYPIVFTSSSNLGMSLPVDARVPTDCKTYLGLRLSDIAIIAIHNARAMRRTVRRSELDQSRAAVDPASKANLFSHGGVFRHLRRQWFLVDVHCPVWSARVA